MYQVPCVLPTVVKGRGCTSFTTSEIAAAVFLLTVLVPLLAAGQDYAYVTTKYGVIRGHNLSVEGAANNVGAYLGVPYSQPPVGDLRFKRTLPPKPWNTTLDVLKMPPACVQYSQYKFPWYDSLPGQSEDCLYLNVWAPLVNRTALVPVKLYIHGGGFAFGSSRMGYYDGRDEAVDLMENGYGGGWDAAETIGSVVVVPNYRLGAMGFLTSGSEDAPGNVGIYDLLAVLRFVKEHAAAFGGDPTRITLVGEDAGSIAASLLCFAPPAAGLFVRAVTKSGNFLSVRGDKFRDNLRISQRIADEVGCGSLETGPEETVRCLRNVSALQLAKVLNSFYPTSLYSLYPQYGQDDLLPYDPNELLSQDLINEGVEDIMTGYLGDEGSYLLTTSYPDEFGVFGEKDVPVNDTFAKTVLTKYLEDRAYPSPAEIADKLLNKPNSTETTRKLLYDAMGDENVVCPTIFFAEKLSDMGHRVYISKVDVHPAYNPWATWMGSVHFNDVQSQILVATFRPYVINGETYNRNESQVIYNAEYNYLLKEFLYDGGHYHIPPFTRGNRRYSYDTDLESKIYVRDNPQTYNCEVLRPYQEPKDD